MLSFGTPVSADLNSAKHPYSAGPESASPRSSSERSKILTHTSQVLKKACLELTSSPDDEEKRMKAGCAALSQGRFSGCCADFVL